MISFDTETRNLRWWEGSAFLATWAGPDSEDWAELVPHPNGGRLRHGRIDRFVDAIAQHEVLIAHNSKFDAHQTRDTIGYDIFENGHTLHDTALMSRVVYGSSRWNHGLEELSKDVLPDGGKAATKASISDVYKELSGRTSMAHDDAYWDVWLADPDALEAYAMADVRDTYDLFQILWPQLEADERLMKVYRLELEVQEVLYHAERRGVLVDPEAVARLQAHHAEQETEHAAALQDWLGFLPEGEGADELLRQRLPELGVELTERTEKSGELAVNQKALSRFADHPAVAALFEWRRARKFQTTYLSAFEGRETVHPDFMQAEAKTSRMSCRRPNLQNLPKRRDTDEDTNLRIRSVFVPRPGYEFIVSDYDQIEPRLLAWYLGDPGYRQVVAEGRTYEKACKAAWPVDALSVETFENDFGKGGRLEHLRPVGKMIYLAIVYGAGGRAVRDQINAMAPPEYHVDLDWVKDPSNKYDTPPMANALKKRIVASIPGFQDLASTNKRYPGRIMKQCRKDGFVRTLMGRKQWVPKGDDGEPMYYVMLNALIQGSAAEIMKQAAVNVTALLEAHGGYPLLFVHDELVCEVPAGTGAELAPLVSESMEAAAPHIEPTLTAESVVTDRSYAHA